MKYFTLIWMGLRRKKMRTFLTMLSISAAFLLFGVLQAVNSGLDNVAGDLNVYRLFSQNKYSMVEGMPVSHTNRIARVSGVTDVSYLAYFGGFYQDRRNPIGVFATDVPALFRLYDEYGLPKEQLEAMQRTRTGALISRDLALQYGWKIGDTVPLTTSIWTRKDGRHDYPFEVVGIFDLVGMGAGTGRNSFFVNFDYFDAARLFGTGTVHYFVIGIDDPARADAIAAAVDAQFENSGNETKTESEQAFLGNQLKQVADIGFIVNLIVGAVIVTLLFLTANTMMQSIRERIPELAVLKTLGFTDATVATLVLCESVLLCVLSAAVGLALARLAFAPISVELGDLEFRSVVLVQGFVIAVVLAIASGALPAIRARRLKIVDALASR